MKDCNGRNILAGETITNIATGFHYVSRGTQMECIETGETSALEHSEAYVIGWKQKRCSCGNQLSYDEDNGWSCGICQ